MALLRPRCMQVGPIAHCRGLLETCVAQCICGTTRPFKAEPGQVLSLILIRPTLISSFCAFTFCMSSNVENTKDCTVQKTFGNHWILPSSPSCRIPVSTHPLILLFPSQERDLPATQGDSPMALQLQALQACSLWLILSLHPQHSTSHSACANQTTAGNRCSLRLPAPSDLQTVHPHRDTATAQCSFSDFPQRC